ncbi:MAG: NrsF family protein [Bradyrhizobium sp.]
MLTAHPAPVRRLRPPLVRATCWLLLAALVLFLMAIGHGMRPNVLQRLEDSTFAIGLTGSLSTGILAAIAAFLVSLPDRSRWWFLLPAPAFAVWMSTIGYGCLTNWVVVGPDGMHLGETAKCFATLVLTSLPLSLAMLAMLRFAAPLRPTNAILLGSLAVAGITATALSLFHPLDATVMILAFNLGVALLIVGSGGVLSLWMRLRAQPRNQDYPGL